MITSTDSEYKATKLIKEGKATLEQPFAELAAWISSTWQVSVLNIIYDQLPLLNKRPRLQVVLEHTREYRKFFDGYNFDQRKQESIAARFAEIVNRQEQPRYNVDGLLVVFSAFAPVAREEANSQITDEELRKLQRHIANPELWTIHRCFRHVTFLFYKDKQAQWHKRKGFRDIYAGMYFDLMRQHDTFDYLRRSRFSVEFDSKENFDKNYEGNWFYFDR